MRKITILIGLAICTMSLGCILQPMVTAFDEAPFLAAQGEGNATITGQAFLKTLGGDVKFGAGNEVELVPSTPYSDERYQRVMINRESLAERDQRIERFTKKATADGNGNFEFKNIKPGKYYLYCLIKWNTGYTTTGGYAHATVEIKENESKKVVVTS